MTKIVATTPAFTSGFLMSKIGKATADLFAAKVVQLGLRPKHCGLLAVAAASPGMSQQELGKAVGLVPSAIVTILDDLKALGAIQRLEDPVDRRRYGVELTSRGESLLLQSAKLAQEVDEQILRGLTVSERDALGQSLRKVAATVGIVGLPEGNNQAGKS